MQGEGSAQSARLSTFAALKGRNYRLYWFGLVLYVLGHRAEYVTFAWITWEVAKNPLALGYLGLDADLAALYGVPTRALSQAVRRNRPRFPADFMFRLSVKEVANLKSQTVISSSSRGWGGRRYVPCAIIDVADHDLRQSNTPM